MFKLSFALFMDVCTLEVFKEFYLARPKVIIAMIQLTVR